MSDWLSYYEDLATWGDREVALPITADDSDACYSDPRSPPPEVTNIDTRVLALENELAELRVRRERILADRALVNRIPAEIISRIFELGVHESYHFLPSVCLVSRQWRDLALATPQLWSYIRLDYHWGYGHSAAFHEWMTVCLERSQSCKILVELDCRYLDALLELRSIAADLAPHLGRCFSFRLSVSDWEWVTVMKEHSHLLGPELEELYLQLDPNDSEDQAPFTFLSNPCPRLRIIVLESTPLIAIRTELPLLQVLHIIRDQRYTSSTSSARISISLKELLSLMKSAPSLQDLLIQSASFLLDGTESIFQPQPERFAVPILEHVSFHFLDSTNVAHFLDTVQLPSLDRLSLQLDSHSDETLAWLDSRLMSQGHLNQLTQLDLRGVNTDCQALPSFIRALHNLPELTALGLSTPPNQFLGSKLFDFLASGPPWLVPKLEALAFQACRDVSGHEILGVVRARNGNGGWNSSSLPMNVGWGMGVQPIRFLKITQCYALDPDVLEVLKRMVEVVHTQ